MQWKAPKRLPKNEMRTGKDSKSQGSQSEPMLGAGHLNSILACEPNLIQVARPGV